MKIVERVLVRRIRKLVNTNAMKFGFSLVDEPQKHCWLWEERQRNIGIGRKSCICVSWILRRLLIEFQERSWSRQ